MNKTVINTFTDAMNKDISKSMMSNKSYLDAHNYRLVATDNNTSGTLENVKGNYKISDSIVDEGQKIIGSCEIRDKVVLFTASDDGRSIIYVIEIDLEAEDQTSITTIYDDDYTVDSSRLNFLVTNPIRAVGRYETPNIQKIYWTDGVNKIRHANIAKNLTVDGTAHVALADDYMGADKFEFLPIFLPFKPTLVDIIGGNINTGVIAYSYQLYMANGAETAFSPTSDPIHVVVDNDKANTSLNYNGSKEQVNSGKGFILHIENSITGFNRLRLIRIEYSSFGSIPNVYIANEIEISTDVSDIDITDTGDVLSELTVDEFNIMSTELFTCQDIDSKDNRLFVSNITKSDFIVDDTWDARAVRFTEMGLCVLQDSEQGVASISAGFDTWEEDYPIDHDGINPFNDTDNDGDTDYEFKYKADGMTLGAEGKNIAIEFDTEDVIIDSSNSRTSFYTSSPSDATDLSYESYSSPWKGGKLSWQRDEIYRLFVVCGDDRGRVSDPKWIIDLRMPSLHEANYSTLSSYDVGTGATKTTRLYPKVYFKSFPSNASWAQIYRVKRERKDRSVVTQGLVVPTMKKGNYYIPNRINSLNLETAGVELVKLVSPEVNITRNITGQGNDYLEFVTYYDDTNSYRIFENSGTGNLNRHTYKLQTNIDIPFTLFTRTNVIDSIPIVSASTWTDYQILNSKTYINYHYDSTYAKGSSGLLVNYDNTAWSAEGIPFAISNYKSYVYGSQYGGHTYEDRMGNVSIPCSDIISAIEEWNDVSYGDTFINYFDVSTLLYDLTRDNFSGSLSEVVYVPLESSVNCELRHDKSQQHMVYDITTSCLRQEYAGKHEMTWVNVEPGVDLTVSYEQEDDLYLYNTVYSQQIDVRSAVSLFSDQVFETEFDCMVKASHVKSNGEISDSWTKFGVNEFIEVDSSYGSINALKTFNNTLYYWQERGFGVLSVNERSLITDDNSSKLVLGTGGVLDRYDYISIHVGCQDKFSITSSINGLYWFDRLVKSIYKFSNGLSNLTRSKYMQSYTDTQIDEYHVSISHADTDNNEVLFTFYKEDGTNGFTLVFSELVDAFVSFYDFIPVIYIPYKHRYLTTTIMDFSDDEVDRDYLFLHNSNIAPRCNFYGADSYEGHYVKSTIELMFNPEYLSTKVFDNLFFITNSYDTTVTYTELYGDTFKYIQCYNDYQNTGLVELILKTNLERRERGWTFAIPRNIVDTNVSDNPDIFTDIDPSQLFKERMRDKYLIVYLEYVNDGTSQRFVFSNIGLKYRTSER